mgnify:FL=1
MNINNFKINNTLLFAVLTFLFGILLLNFMGITIKVLRETYSAYQISLFRNIFGFIPIIIIFYFVTDSNEKKLSFAVPRLWLLFLRGGFITVAQLCFFTSLLYLEFATAIALSFAMPIFVTMFSIPILKKKVGIYRWSAVLLGICGIFLIVRPNSDVFSIYALLPIGAAIGYAMSMITVKLFPENISSVVIQGYSQFSSIIFSAVFLFFLGQTNNIENLNDLILFITLGIVGGLGVLLLIIAYRMTNPTNVAPFEYFGIIFSFILGYLFFGETPFEKLFPGVFAIIGAGLLILWRERILKNRIH